MFKVLSLVSGYLKLSIKINFFIFILQLFQKKIKLLNRDKGEISLFILIFNHLVFRDKIQIHDIFKKNKIKYLVNKTFILIFKVLVFKDKLRNCEILFILIFKIFILYLFSRKENLDFFRFILIFMVKIYTYFRACLFQSEEG
jgi:hypothetical protein